jgi:hypothetical protein
MMRETSTAALPSPRMMRETFALVANGLLQQIVQRQTPPPLLQ